MTETILSIIALLAAFGAGAVTGVLWRDRPIKQVNDEINDLDERLGTIERLVQP